MYKYCPVTEYSLRNLENGEFYLNYYEDFNDPYECMCEIYMGFPKLSDRSDRLMAVLNAWGFGDYDDPAVIEYYEDYADSLECGEPVIEDFIDNARITCFSASSDNLLMWGHYANGLRGFCLEVDEEILVKNNESAKIYPVIYSDKPATIDASVLAVLYDQLEYHSTAAWEIMTKANIPDAEKPNQIQGYHEWYLADLDRVQSIYQKMLATKPVSWKYEEEIRLIVRSPGCGKAGVKFSYPKESIKSILLGGKISAEDESRLLDIVSVKYPEIPIKKMITKKGQFQLEQVELYSGINGGVVAV